MENYKNKQISKNKILGLVVILGLLIYIVNIRPALANYKANLGLIQLQLSSEYNSKYIEKGSSEHLEAAKNSFTNGVLYLEKAINYNTYQNTEFREGYSEAVISIPLENIFSEIEINNFLNKIMLELEKNIEDNPKSAKPYLQAMAVYNKGAKYNKKYLSRAEELGKKIFALGSHHPQIYYELGKTKFYQAKYDEGINYFKEAIDLNPDNITSHWNLAISYIKIDKIAEAKAEIEVMEKIGYFVDTLPQIQKWIGIYEQVNDVKKVVNIAAKEFTL